METVYQYDYQGFFVSETYAYQGLPHNCTKVKPKIQSNFIPQWNGSTWKQVEDYRQKKDGRDRIIEGTGTPYWLPGDTWKTEPRYMTEPGPLPKNAILTRPEPDPTILLKEAKEQVFLDIDTSYNETLMNVILAPTPESSGKSIEEIRTILSTQRAEFELQLQQATTVEEVKSIHIVYSL